MFILRVEELRNCDAVFWRDVVVPHQVAH